MGWNYNLWINWIIIFQKYLVSLYSVISSKLKPSKLFKVELNRETHFFYKTIILLHINKVASPSVLSLWNANSAIILITTL